jgi:hypothetical protein
VHLVSFFWRRIYDAISPLKTRLSKFTLKDLGNNKVAVTQGKLLLEIILKRTL